MRSFDVYFAELDQVADSVCKNVRKLLAVSFFNHWYAALLLVEAGLAVDAILCERNALETLAFHWLVCLDPAAADEYHSGGIPRPFVVRRRLQALGADISHIRESYRSGSEISHVGRRAEQFHLRWEGDRTGQLMVGGVFRRDDVEHRLAYLPVLLDLFQHPLLVQADTEAPGV